MRRSLLFVLLFAFLLVVTACGEKKPPNPSAVKGKNVLSALRDMTQAYEKKSLDSFMTNVAEGFPEKEAFSSTLASIFTNYETIHFNVQYTRMLILVQDRGQIKVSCNWDAEWLATKGTSRKSGGRVTFAFDPDNFKLVAIEGNNPFIPTESTLKQ